MARRSSMFARSDIRDAAEQFVTAMVEHADDGTDWEQGDYDALAEALTDAAFVVLRDCDATFGTRPAEPQRPITAVTETK